MNYKALREYLIDYFGSGGMMGEVIAVESASDKKLIEIAKRWHIDLDKFHKENDY